MTADSTPDLADGLEPPTRAPGATRRPARRRWLAMAAVLMGVPLVLWMAGFRFGRSLFGNEVAVVPTLRVDRGDMARVVVESGALESAENATVKCMVEAVIGTVSNSSGGMGGGMGGGGGGAAGGGRTGRFGTAASTGRSGSGGTRSGGMGGAGGAGGSAAAGRATTASSSVNIGVTRPTIRSFSMTVAPHTPLRPASATSSVSTTNQSAFAQMGGPGGRGGGGGGMMEERAGSTRILKILEEGTAVEKDQIVCWLDDADFRDALDAQMITWAQAKSWLEQAEKVLEVSRIELEEYRQGILEQDKRQIEDYILMCQTQRRQSEIDLKWAEAMAARTLLSESQVRSRRYSLERTDVAVREAIGMRERLLKYTAPRLITNLEAKIASVQADVAAQRAAFEREDQRKRRLERAIENCVLRAPRAGSVVYVNESNGWGSVETQIREGTTVRENQAIFAIPDPTRMRVKARINESKVAYIKAGDPALVHVDAFPDRLLKGRVTGVTVIPQPANGPFSDIKVYFAYVEILDGFDGLASGMSARVEVLTEDRPEVTRVPVVSLRYFDGKPFAAVPVPAAGTAATPGHAWRRLEVGMIDEQFAEVRDGLREGDLVIADPSALAPPTSAERGVEAAVAQAAAPPVG